MKPSLSRAFLWWLPLAVGLTGIFGVVSVVVQQNYRQSANDPQVQLAEDAATALSAGVQIDQIVPTQKVNIENSLSPWVTFYTNTGVPLLSSGELNGASPQLPQGVFDTTTWRTPMIARYWSEQPPQNETRFTWQPSPDARQAVVLIHYDTPNGIGFVAAGRNLREIEIRESALEEMTITGWGVTELATLVVILVLVILGVL